MNTGEEQQIEQFVNAHIFTLRLKCIARNLEHRLSAIALIADNLTPVGPVAKLPAS